MFMSSVLVDGARVTALVERLESFENVYDYGLFERLREFVTELFSA